MFALVDGNSFYCSCERVFNPKLRNKPVAVLSNNDGIIIASTREVKDLGIPLGAAFFEVKDALRKHDVQVFSSNYALYGSMSQRVVDVLRRYGTRMEVYSIDESFLELEPGAELEQVGWTIRRAVLKETGIPCGVGIAPTKTLAKVANKAAKKGSGVKVLSSDASDLLATMPCDALWGIAGRLSKRLQAFGIDTALKLAHADHRVIRAKFGVVLERMVLELNGVPCLSLDEVVPDRKNICCSRSFGHRITALEELREAVATFASRGGEKRRQGLAASAVHVFLQTDSFRPDQPQYFPSACRELLTPTSYTPALVTEADTCVAVHYVSILIPHLFQ